MSSVQITFDITSHRPSYGPREVPFTRIAHCTHRKVNLIKMLRSVSNNGSTIHFKGKKHSSYEQLPALSWWDSNRYVPICFSIPLKNVPGEFYCGDARTFTHEYAHTTIFNINKKRISEKYPESKFRRDSEVNDRNTALYSIIPEDLVNIYDGNDFLWRCYRWGNNENPNKINYKWDHPEFAIVAGKDGFDFTAAQGLKIHFVDHKNALCVKIKYSCNEICDMCWTAEQVCIKFVRIIHKNGMIFENFQPFFEQEIWNELVYINNTLYK
ncbi:unnamed protein product [Rotaria sp. Silwood2]|nr:unnamed protein product [Rotaria sp. Silwood2]